MHEGSRNNMALRRDTVRPVIFDLNFRFETIRVSGTRHSPTEFAESSVVVTLSVSKTPQA